MATDTAVPEPNPDAIGIVDVILIVIAGIRDIEVASKTPLTAFERGLSAGRSFKGASSPIFGACKLTQPEGWSGRPVTIALA
jgi:hypothetical protein